MKIKKIIVICVSIGLISSLGYFSIKYCLSQNLKRQKQELQEIINQYGVLEKESIENTVSKFNTQIQNNSTLNIASNNYLTIDNEQYWYGLVDGVYCFVIPEKFTGDLTKDVTKKINIYHDKESDSKEDVIKYVKFLIKANNEEITEEEINQLINEALELSNINKVANNGKGITLGIYENNEYYEYQVTRLYK